MPLNFRMSPRVRRALTETGIFLVFVALTCVMTWPWVWNLRDAVADKGDSYIFSWILWWDYHQTFTDPLNLFHANIFYPSRYTLAFSEHVYGIALLCFPLFALGLRPVTVTGIATLLGFALCGYGAFRLARTLTGSTGAGWVAGVAFAFLPPRFNLLAHLDYLFAGWIPLLVEALVLFARERGRKRAAWLGVAFLMNALTCITWFVLTLIPLGATTLVLLLHHKGLARERRFWLRGGLAVATASLALLPFLLPYYHVSKLYGFERGAGEVAGYSSHLTDWLVADQRNKLWEGFGSGYTNMVLPLFPGLLLPLLALAAVACAARAAYVSVRVRRTTDDGRSLRATADPQEHGDARLVFSVGVVWLALGFAGSLGLNFFFHRFLYEYVPVFRAVRSPARWSMAAYVGLALLACVGARALVKALAGKDSRGRVAAVFALVCAALLFEFRAAPLYLERGETDPDAVTLRLKETPMRGGIVELPAGESVSNHYYVLRAADHARPLVTAASGFVTPVEAEIERLTHARPVPERLLDLLEEIPVSYLVIHNTTLTPESRLALEDFIARGAAAGRLRFIRSFGERDDLYAIVRTEPTAVAEAPAPPPARARDFLPFYESRAAYLPEELRADGFLVYRLYKVANGRPPRRDEFLTALGKLSETRADAETVGRIGETSGDARARRALAERLSGQAVFQEEAGGLSNAQYVDWLWARAGLAPTFEERAALVEGLDGKVLTRAAALERVAANESLYLKEFNRAFVLMHFFHYLGRNPDDPPDRDLSGLDFWTAYLDRTGDYKGIPAAFRRSREYEAKRAGDK